MVYATSRDEVGSGKEVGDAYGNNAGLTGEAVDYRLVERVGGSMGGILLER